MMVRPGLAAWAFLLCSPANVSVAQTSPLTLVSSATPAWPPIALTANVYGDVIVEVSLNEDGSVASSKLVSGHPLLQQAAIENSLTWKFAAPNGQPLKGEHFAITYQFQMEGEMQCSRGPVRVSFESYNRVELVTNPGALCDPGHTVKRRKHWYLRWL